VKLINLDRTKLIHIFGEILNFQKKIKIKISLATYPQNIMIDRYFVNHENPVILIDKSNKA